MGAGAELVVSGMFRPRLFQMIATRFATMTLLLRRRYCRLFFLHRRLPCTKVWGAGVCGVVGVCGGVWGCVGCVCVWCSVYVSVCRMNQPSAGAWHECNAAAEGCVRDVSAGPHRRRPPRGTTRRPLRRSALLCQERRCFVAACFRLACHTFDAYAAETLSPSNVSIASARSHSRSLRRSPSVRCHAYRAATRLLHRHATVSVRRIVLPLRAAIFSLEKNTHGVQVAHRYVLVVASLSHVPSGAGYAYAGRRACYRQEAGEWLLFFFHLTEAVGH